MEGAVVSVSINMLCTFLLGTGLGLSSKLSFLGAGTGGVDFDVRSPAL